MNTEEKKQLRTVVDRLVKHLKMYTFEESSFIAMSLFATIKSNNKTDKELKEFSKKGVESKKEIAKALKLVAINGNITKN